MQQLQNFNPSDFDSNGRAKDGSLFTDLMENWEREFYSEFKPIYANYLHGNFRTLQIIQSCFDSEELERWGIDGDYDLETNIKIDDSRKKHVPIVYALGSLLKENEGEPVYLVEDTTMADGVVLLKYKPENDGDAEMPNEPAPSLEKEIEEALGVLKDT